MLGSDPDISARWAPALEGWALTHPCPSKLRPHGFSWAEGDASAKPTVR